MLTACEQMSSVCCWPISIFALLILSYQIMHGKLLLTMKISLHNSSIWHEQSQHRFRHLSTLVGQSAALPCSSGLKYVLNVSNFSSTRSSLRDLVFIAASS